MGKKKKAPEEMWQAARTYRVLKAGIPATLDDCWSACNGVDGFGQDDEALEAARKKHGEVLENVPGCPRLILYRWRRESALSAKLWYLQTVQPGEDLQTMWAAFARALVECKGSYKSAAFDALLYDWSPDGAHPNDRYEFSVEVCGLLSHLGTLKSAMDEFVTLFDRYQKEKPE